MISHTKFLTSTNNVVIAATLLLCTAQLSPMILSTKVLKQAQNMLYRPLRTSRHNNDLSLYEQAKKVGGPHCSEAYETGTCLSPVCCKNLYNMPYADTKDKWAAAKIINEHKRSDILNNIDIQSASRITFIDKINKDIEDLSEIIKKAHWKYLYSEDQVSYKELCTLIDHLIHCKINLLHVVENDTGNLWKECQTFTLRELRDNPDKRHQIAQVLALCAQEPVTQKSCKLLEERIQRDRLISNQTTE